MKTALVTGVSGGMGYATAHALTRAGYTVYGLDVNAPENTEGISFLKADLADERAVKAAFDAMDAQNVKLDAIIHMAGIYDLNSLMELDEDAFLRIFQVNLFAAYRVNKTFLPLFNEKARIIITTSELAPLDPLPFTGVYAITKSALDKYACSLRMELQLLGYSVIVLRPGAVDTGLLTVSTQKLDEFTSSTRLYRFSAERFRSVVNRVEARKVAPDKVASLALRALRSKRPRYVYTINRNPGLLLLNALPDRAQHAIIRKLLKTGTPNDKIDRI